MTLVIGASARVAVAQTDEIQVYDASHAGPGVFNLTWHNNFTPAGVDRPAFPGAVVADKSFNGVNPILDTAYDGLKNLDFAPETRVAYNLSTTWAIAAEEYADYGPLRQLYPPSAQIHQLYAVVDRAGNGLDVEFGVGFGLTNASDRLTLKLLLARDLNGRHKARNRK